MRKAKATKPPLDIKFNPKYLHAMEHCSNASLSLFHDTRMTSNVKRSAGICSWALFGSPMKTLIWHEAFDKRSHHSFCEQCRAQNRQPQQSKRIKSSEKPSSNICWQKHASTVNPIVDGLRCWQMNQPETSRLINWLLCSSWSRHIDVHPCTNKYTYTSSWWAHHSWPGLS